MILTCMIRALRCAPVTRFARAFLGLTLMVCLAMGAARAEGALVGSYESWPAWESFKASFISDDGRVIDPMHADQRTVSEGQAYALLFALIGNDRDSFDRLLNWTQDNLSQGDLTKHLPAWLWGLHAVPEAEQDVTDEAVSELASAAKQAELLPEGADVAPPEADEPEVEKTWGVIDANAASDADVWIAYALLEAGRLWSDPAYTAVGEKMIANIKRREVMKLPGLGRVLMPAPYGFVETKQRYRINPSYLALQPLRHFLVHTGDPVWQEVLDTSRRILIDAAPRGLAGDWVLWKTQSGFQADEKSVAAGSYDSIRVYLWLGMLHAADPDRADLLAHHAPLRSLLDVRGRPPEFIDINTGQTRGIGPGGFSAALLPFFSARGEVLPLLQQKIHMAMQSASDQPRYYDQVLRLFGHGWDQGRYRFGEKGSLHPYWEQMCGPNPIPFASPAPAR